MKKIVLIFTAILSLNSMAASLSCSKARGVTYIILGGINLECTDSDDNKYDVAIGGVSLGLRATGGGARIGIWCPGKVDVRGTYAGVRGGVALGIGGDIAAFGSATEGLCLLGGLTTSLGANLDAAFMDIQDQR